MWDIYSGNSITKKLIKINIELCTKSLPNISPQKAWQQPPDTWKRKKSHHCQSLGKCKLNPPCDPIAYLTWKVHVGKDGEEGKWVPCGWGENHYRASNIGFLIITKARTASWCTDFLSVWLFTQKTWGVSADVSVLLVLCVTLLLWHPFLSSSPLSCLFLSFFSLPWLQLSCLLFAFQSSSERQSYFSTVYTSTANTPPLVLQDTPSCCSTRSSFYGHLSSGHSVLTFFDLFIYFSILYTSSMSNSRVVCWETFLSPLTHITVSLVWGWGKQRSWQSED